MTTRARPARPKTLSTAFEATRLLGKWTKLAQGHVMFGAGCSCGASVGLRLQDFEQQILDFLYTRHGAAALERAGYRQAEAGSVTALLRAVATQRAVEQPAGEPALLADLERSLDSFDELHRGR